MDATTAGIAAAAGVATAQLTGARFGPTSARPRTAAWYASLRKPAFTPPGPVFGAAWTALDAMLAYAGYRLLRAPPSSARALALGAWTANLLGIAGFSRVLFGQRRLGAATAVSAAMLASSGVLVAAAEPVDRRAAQAAAPLLAWLLFATLLQEEVWRRN